MVKEIHNKMEQPIKTGNALLLIITGLSIIGFIFYGSIKLLFSNMIILPQQNRESIQQLFIRQSISEECIQQLKRDVVEIKDKQKEMSDDIKDILKKLK